MHIIPPLLLSAALSLLTLIFAILLQIYNPAPSLPPPSRSLRHISALVLLSASGFTFVLSAFAAPFCRYRPPGTTGPAGGQQDGQLERPPRRRVVRGLAVTALNSLVLAAGASLFAVELAIGNQEIRIRTIDIILCVLSLLALLSHLLTFTLSLSHLLALPPRPPTPPATPPTGSLSSARFSPTALNHLASRAGRVVSRSRGRTRKPSMYTDLPTSAGSGRSRDRVHSGGSEGALRLPGSGSEDGRRRSISLPTAVLGSALRRGGSSEDDEGGDEGDGMLQVRRERERSEREADRERRQQAALEELDRELYRREMEGVSRSSRSAAGSATRSNMSDERLHRARGYAEDDEKADTISFEMMDPPGPGYYYGPSASPSGGKYFYHEPGYTRESPRGSPVDFRAGLTLAQTRSSPRGQDYYLQQTQQALRAAAAGPSETGPSKGGVARESDWMASTGPAAGRAGGSRLRQEYLIGEDIEVEDDGMDEYGHVVTGPEDVREDFGGRNSQQRRSSGRNSSDDDERERRRDSMDDSNSDHEPYRSYEGERSYDSSRDPSASSSPTQLYHPTTSGPPSGSVTVEMVQVPRRPIGPPVSSQTQPSRMGLGLGSALSGYDWRPLSRVDERDGSEVSDTESRWTREMSAPRSQGHGQDDRRRGSQDTDRRLEGEEGDRTPTPNSARTGQDSVRMGRPLSRMATRRPDEEGGADEDEEELEFDTFVGGGRLEKVVARGEGKAKREEEKDDGRKDSVDRRLEDLLGEGGERREASSPMTV